MTIQIETTPLAAAKNMLANLRAELASRTQDAEAAHERAETLADRVAVLYAESVLDGIDHTRRIAEAQQEIARLEADLDGWPAVQAELNRRIQTADDNCRDALELDRAETLAQMADTEADLRQQYAAAAVLLFEVAAQIGDIHETRTQMRSAMVDEYTSGKRPSLAGAPTNPPLPVFPAKALFHRQHLAEALRVVRSA